MKTVTMISAGMDGGEQPPRLTIRAREYRAPQVRVRGIVRCHISCDVALATLRRLVLFISRCCIQF